MSGEGLGLGADHGEKIHTWLLTGAHTWNPPPVVRNTQVCSGRVMNNSTAQFH